MNELMIVLTKVKFFLAGRVLIGFRILIGIRAYQRVENPVRFGGCDTLKIASDRCLGGRFKKRTQWRETLNVSSHSFLSVQQGSKARSS